MEPKKNSPYDLDKKRKFHLAIGLIVSLSLVTVAFEWRTRIEPIEIPPLEEIADPVLPPIPATVHEPPKPKVVQPEIIPVPDDEEIAVDVDIILDVQISDDEIENYMADVAPPEETAEDVILFAETQPSFPDGLDAFYRYVSQAVNYPPSAIRRGISGKVYVEFVVDKDGSLSNLNVVKGIGGGCDEEALRVIKNSPSWNPGKQRGKPVRVRMVVPISFTLQ